jgi:D-glycero-D-manno-heptose 1,7-bisphosphate phosphatase
MNLFRKVVFLDRDGVINQDSPDYIKSWSEFKFLPGSIEAIRDLTSGGFDIIVVTNQSAIPRKLISSQELKYIHMMMKDAVESKGGQIKDIFFCPHLPSDECDCRKPAPGLVYQAQSKYRLDLATSIMIGDSAKDIECARNAGCGQTILVKTGNGKEAERILTNKGIFPDFVAEDLYDASQWLLSFQI